MSTVLIKNGFRECGIYPLNRNAIDNNRFTQDKVYSAATATTPSSTTLYDAISTKIANEDQPDERSYEETIIRADNEPSDNISKLNLFESPSTPVIPLVAVGIILSHILESFVIPAAKEQTQTIPRVITKGRWLASDEHTRLYEEKLDKIWKDNEAKEKWKAESAKEGVSEQEVELPD